jgi:hypothetical protein
MPAQIHQLSDTEGPTARDQQPSLEQLLQQSRNLLTEGADQIRDISRLAFLELELAVASSKRWLWGVLMFSASSLLSCTFLIAALAVLLLDTATPAVVLLLCGIGNAIVASALYFWVRSLSRKMAFQNLRQQLHKNDRLADVHG